MHPDQIPTLAEKAGLRPDSEKAETSTTSMPNNQDTPATTTPHSPLSLSQKISHIRHDITKLHVSCIVNAANKRLLGGGGVDGAIHAAAGPGLLDECRTLNGCSTGSAKMTDAYDLPCNKIVHAVGPVYHNAEKSEPLLRGCYRKSLELAVENQCRSVAFSAISTGVYGYPNDEAAHAAISEVKDFLLNGEGRDAIDRVIFVTFVMADVNAYENILPTYFLTSKNTTEPKSGTVASSPLQPAHAAKDRQAETTFAAESVAASLPDPPQNEPNSPGHPMAKRQKIDSVDDDKT